MICVRRRIAVLFLISLFTSPLLVYGEERSLAAQIDRLMVQIDNMIAEQDRMQAEQEEILNEIGELKVIINKHR